jgi:subtilisin family serine protease
VTRWGPLVIVLLATLGFGAPASATPSQPNDPAFGLQWNLPMVGAPSAWQVATGANVTIAVVDSGVDLQHGDLQGGKIVGHADCVAHDPCRDNSPQDGQDDFGHGTHVAGIAAANTNNGIGVAGVAPDASILDVKVLDSTGSGSADDVARGIRYAADHGAAVINLSLGNISQSLLGTPFQDALDYAFTKKGALPVIAAGNNFVLTSGPITHAIVVGALNRSGLKASYSNIGSSQWVIDAPGGEPDDTNETCASAPLGVLSTYFNNSYACLAGTSMAAPHVAGAAAILSSLGLTNQQIVDKLLATARALPTTSVDGAGALDVAAAVGRPPTPPPDTTPQQQTTQATGATATAPGGGGPSGSSSASTPAGDAGGPTSTAPILITPPNQQAAPPTGRVTTRSKNNDGVSPAIVGAAILMAGSVGGIAGWFALRGSNLFRRTPRSDG